MKGNASLEGFGAFRAVLDRFADGDSESVHSVDVGVITTAKYPRRKEMEEARSVLQVAVWNEFGTRGGASGGGWGGPVPPRPFIRNAAEISSTDQRIIDTIREGITPESPSFDEKTAMKIGAIMKGNMVESMQDPRLAPNAPLTIRLKKSSQPLHDTGLLRRSIDFRVNKTEPKDTDDGFVV